MTPDFFSLQAPKLIPTEYAAWCTAHNAVWRHTAAHRRSEDPKIRALGQYLAAEERRLRAEAEEAFSIARLSLLNAQQARA